MSFQETHRLFPQMLGMSARHNSEEAAMLPQKLCCNKSVDFKDAKNSYFIDESRMCNFNIKMNQDFSCTSIMSRNHSSTEVYAQLITGSTGTSALLIPCSLTLQNILLKRRRIQCWWESAGARDLWFPEKCSLILGIFKMGFHMTRGLRDQVIKLCNSIYKPLEVLETLDSKRVQDRKLCLELLDFCYCSKCFLLASKRKTTTINWFHHISAKWWTNFLHQ